MSSQSSLPQQTNETELQEQTTIGSFEKDDHDSSSPSSTGLMYDRETMDRNLGIGDVGEAVFRYWFETNLHGLDDIVLDQFGYNPDGVVEDAEKSAMLKEREDAPDFALFHRDEYEAQGTNADPIVGISINTQRGWFGMSNNPGAKLDYESELLDESDWGCHTCPKADECYNGDLRNLWYNEYNISNDYRLFTETYNADVIMVSIISTTPYNVHQKFDEDDELLDACRTYLMNGEASIDDDGVISFLDELVFDQRYKNRTEQRDQTFVFVTRSGVVRDMGDDGFHVTQSSVGSYRPVTCIDESMSQSEQQLVDLFAEFSDHTPSDRAPHWYLGQTTFEQFV